LHHDSPIQHEGRAIGQALDQAEIVRDQKYGDVLAPQLLELLHAPAGEDRVADGQRFIDNQDLGIDVNRGGKCEADIHAAGVLFHRAIDELADFGESFDARKRLVQFLARQSQDLAIEIHIFAAAEFGIEAGAQFEQRRDAPGAVHPAAGGLQNAADDLQQSAFSRSVRPKKREHFTLLDAQVDVSERPKLGLLSSGNR
jgi:hypothetical protein